MTFFAFLKPILERVEECIAKTFKADDVGTVFDKYFDKARFLEEFDGSITYQFVLKLVNGASFQHFCDDFFSDELTNYQMFKAILVGAPQIKENVKQVSNYKQRAFGGEEFTIKN